MSAAATRALTTECADAASLLRPGGGSEGKALRPMNPELRDVVVHRWGIASVHSHLPLGLQLLPLLPRQPASQLLQRVVPQLLSAQLSGRVLQMLLLLWHLCVHLPPLMLLDSSHWLWALVPPLWGPLGQQPPSTSRGTLQPWWSGGLPSIAKHNRSH